jgi:hypothetical protein
VTIVIRRPVGVFVGLAAIAALLTACGSGPSQVGAALIVGNTSVSDSQIHQELTSLLDTQSAVAQAQKQGLLDQVSRHLVTSHVQHELITAAAAKYGLSVPDVQIDQAISRAGGIAKIATAEQVDQTQARSVAKDSLLEVELAQKYADTLSVSFGYVVASTRQEAVQDAQRLAADPNSLTGLVNAANAKAQAGGQQATAGATTATFQLPTYLQAIAQAEQQGQTSSENDSAIFGTPVNSVVAYQPAPSQSPTWIVALIKSRDQSGKPASGTSAATTADPATLAQIGIGLLQPEASSVGVRISPRYGTWDLASMQVAATQSAGLVLPVHSPKS